ncbi:MAG: flagellar motor protein MotB [Phycisphaerales bacterium]
MGRPKKEAPPEEAPGAPLWMVTFSDCMNLLLTFFVLLVTFSAFGPEQQERIINFGNAMRTVFGTPAEAGGSQDQSSMVQARRVVGTEQPEHGSERPTDSKSPTPQSGSLNEDLQAADYRKHKVFLIPSGKVFLGRGRALSPEGRYFLAVMAAFLREVPGSVVISENGPDGQAGSAEIGLSRALVVLEHLVSLENLGHERLSIAAESIAPPEDANGSVLAYHRRERMLEIVLLEGSVQQ